MLGIFPSMVQSARTLDFFHNTSDTTSEHEESADCNGPQTASGLSPMIQSEAYAQADAQWAHAQQALGRAQAKGQGKGSMPMGFQRHFA